MQRRPRSTSCAQIVAKTAKRVYTSAKDWEHGNRRCPKTIRFYAIICGALVLIVMVITATNNHRGQPVITALSINQQTNDQPQSFALTLTAKDHHDVQQWNDNILINDAPQHHWFLKEMIKRGEVKSNVIVDIGMAHGGESINAVKHGLIAYSFEPIPRNIQNIRNNFKRMFYHRN